ncbi:type II toxin-antitoxin system RelE/ParE family toxin [Nitratiruptor sp. YY08-13]|uniref:type II toxin-antitoxin system RelE family toxin n=1 Tax=unclassified Nitratiruptor TaxID=2624044 RepID=UPI001914E8DB
MNKKDQIKIIDTIENRLAINPYSGKKLAGSLSDFYRYRVEKYHIIYSIHESNIEIEIIKIGHRKDIYDLM